MSRVQAVSAEAVRRLEPGGRFTIRVSGTSMVPVLREGDSVTACRVGGPIRPRQGDLLVLDLPGAGLVVHRLVWAGAAGLRTRGDGSGRMDPPVSRDAVLGLVTRVERDGRDVTPTPLQLRWGGLRGLLAAACFRLARRATAATA